MKFLVTRQYDAHQKGCLYLVLVPFSELPVDPNYNSLGVEFGPTGIKIGLQNTSFHEAVKYRPELKSGRESIERRLVEHAFPEFPPPGIRNSRWGAYIEADKIRRHYYYTPELPNEVREVVIDSIPDEWRIPRRPPKCS